MTRIRLVAAALTVSALLPVAAAPVPAASAAAGTASFVAVGPIRLVDTRVTPCSCQRFDPSTIRVDVAAMVDQDHVVAAAVTVTATNSTGPGFVTAYPAGAARPATSTLNMRPGVDTSNASIVMVGADGAIDVYAQHATDLLVDVTGVFIESATAGAGRFQSTTPLRLVDTRETTPGGLVSGDEVVIALPAAAPVDTTAVAVNVTSVGAGAAGYISGFAAGSEPPATSFMNPDGSGAAQAASVILPTSSAGFVVKVSTAGHVVVDVVGWFTGSSGEESADGLFVPVPPNRLLDTRVAGPRIWPGGTREIPLAVIGAAAIVSNLTLARPDDPGFLTAYPAGTERPATSSINAARRDVVAANFAITRMSSRGGSYFSSSGTDLVVDIAGYFIGQPLAATLTAPPNPAPNPRVLLIGDSTMGALNVVPASQTALRGFQPIVDAEPCRRLVRPSCRSAFTNRIPNTAVETIATTPGRIDIVMMRTGYNDGTVGFAAAVDSVVSAARARGVRWVIWLTYSVGTGNQLNTYTRNNVTLRQLAAGGSYPELVIAEWRDYAAGSSGWYASDQVHLVRNGAWATSDYVSRWVAFITRKPCPLPWRLGGVVDDSCPNPDVEAARLGPADVRGLYGLS